MELEKNSNDHLRGLHIVVLDSQSGEVQLAQVFDTYDSSQEFDHFISQHVPNG